MVSFAGFTSAKNAREFYASSINHTVHTSISSVRKGIETLHGKDEKVSGNCITSTSTSICYKINNAIEKHLL